VLWPLGSRLILSTTLVPRTQEHIARAFREFSQFGDRSLEEHVLLRLVPREAGSELWHPLPQKKYKVRTIL
jgi:hypothetical protein